MIRIYGIPNCGTVKQARAWLADKGIAYVFHDFKKDGLDAGRLRAWADELGWETLLNRRGTTWRRLPESVRDGLDETAAIALMLEQPSLIRRPVLDIGEARHLGFTADDYEALLKP